MTNIRKMLHVNPLKMHTQMVNNDAGGQHKEQVAMSLHDAAIVSLVLTVAQIFSVFLTTYNYASIMANAGEFCFTLIKFTGAAFFTQLVVLSGLSKYIAGKKES
ncbi:hypothetical protein MUP59_02000 [Candidatus Bathyarchaeota archaeon]|nr:hypothetical protein [Candidatus Bathyarchaeota archaeon]